MIKGTRMMMKRRGGGWQNPYVTDGLVAMWDGEWNAGGGVLHDSMATTWKDLGPNGYDLTCFGTPDWMPNGINITSKSNIFYRSNCSWFREMWTSASGVYVEAVAIGGVGDIFNVGSEYNSLLSFDLYIINVNNSTKVMNLCRVSSNSATVVNNVDIFRAYGWANSSSVRLSLGNATAVDGTYTYLNDSRSGLALGYRGDLYGSGAFFNGKIFRCAVYNRMLSASEIAANSAIDRARFNLP